MLFRSHYLDDGESFDYQEGKYCHYRFTDHGDGAVETELVHDGYRPYREIKVIGSGGDS